MGPRQGRPDCGQSRRAGTPAQRALPAHLPCLGPAAPSRTARTLPSSAGCASAALRGECSGRGATAARAARAPAGPIGPVPPSAVRPLQITNSERVQSRGLLSALPLRCGALRCACLCVGVIFQVTPTAAVTSSNKVAVHNRAPHTRNSHSGESEIKFLSVLRKGLGWGYSATWKRGSSAASRPGPRAQRKAAPAAAERRH